MWKVFCLLQFKKIDKSLMTTIIRTPLAVETMSAEAKSWNMMMLFSRILFQI